MITRIVTLILVAAAYTPALAVEIPGGGGPEVLAPEPLSSALFMLGAGAFALRSYRKHKKQ
jgi:hypothetical protein